jgi:predicted DNA-binding transcriptional regulator AlpA
MTQFKKHVKAGHLPRPIRLSETGRAVAWVVADLQRWLDERIAARDGAV